MGIRESDSDLKDTFDAAIDSNESGWKPKYPNREMVWG